MHADTELETWRRQWQTDDVIPSDLRQRVDRETRYLRRGRYGEIVVIAVFGGGATGWALLSPRPIVFAFAAGVWFLTGIALVTSNALRKDILKPSAATTTAFLDLSIRRCRRRLVALVAQALLYALILVFDLVWIYHYQTQTITISPWSFLTSSRMLVVWVVTALFATAALWQRRRLWRELRNLLRLQQEVTS
jgi:hypothetical protein